MGGGGKNDVHGRGINRKERRASAGREVRT